MPLRGRPRETEGSRLLHVPTVAAMLAGSWALEVLLCGTECWMAGMQPRNAARQSTRRVLPHSCQVGRAAHNHGNDTHEAERRDRGLMRRWQAARIALVARWLGGYDCKGAIGPWSA